MPRAPSEIRSIARKHSAAAIETLNKIMRQPKAPPAARVAAANSLLDRGWGKPDQHIDVTQKIVDQMSDAELNAELTRIAAVLGLSQRAEAPPPGKDQLH